MGLTNFFREKAESIGIGYLIHGLESGLYGPRLQSVWLALKGRKSIIGWSLAAVGGFVALMAQSDPYLLATGVTIGTIGTYLGRLGLIAKGADKEPHPAFPEEYRDAFQFALSACTGVIEILSGVGGILVLSHSPLAAHISGYAIIAAQGLSTVTGYLSTLIGPTPKQAAQVAVVQAQAAVEVAKDVVVEKKEEAQAVVEIAADIDSKPITKKIGKSS